MVGDGVNDVPALKECDVAVALGSGSQLAKGVADVVLVSESFEAIPFAIEEGRKILRNVQRVAKLFVAKSVFAAVLILTVGVGGGSYPFLPRQLSLAAAITVGIPAFLLALAPAAAGPAARRSCATSPAFADPGGHRARRSRCCSGHGLVHTSIGRSAAESQTTSLTILVFVGLYLVLVLESGSMRRSRVARRARAAARRAARRELPRHPLVPGRAGAFGAEHALGTADRRQRHLHDVRDRRARHARPVAHAAGR